MTQENGTITAADYQKLQLKALLSDNLLEQRSLEERRTVLQQQEKLILEKIKEIDQVVAEQANGHVEPQKEVIEVNEGQIDPETGVLKTPKEEKTTSTLKVTKKSKK